MNEQKEQYECEAQIEKAEREAELPLLTEEEIEKMNSIYVRLQTEKMPLAEVFNLQKVWLELLPRLLDTARQYRKATELSVKLIAAVKMRAKDEGCHNFVEECGETFEEWKRHAWEQGII